MIHAPFWYIDDDRQTRWAVRVTPPREFVEPIGFSSIVFTSHDRQIRTEYLLDKDQAELTRYELLELLGRAKREAAGRLGGRPGAPAAA